MTFGRKIEALLLARILPGLAQQTRPVLEGKRRNIGRAGTELRRPVGLVVEGEQRLPALRHMGGRGRGRGDRRRLRMRCCDRCHHDAAARGRFKIALGVEQVPRRQHHRARAAQLPRDLARSQKLRSGWKDAAQNAAPDVGRDLQMQRHGRIPVDMHPRKGYALVRLTISVHHMEAAVGSAGDGRQRPLRMRQERIRVQPRLDRSSRSCGRRGRNKSDCRCSRIVAGPRRGRTARHACRH